jgi:hypothetical protein
VSEVLTGPNVQRLLDQGKAWDGDNDFLGIQCLRYPESRQRLTCAAWHDHLATGITFLDEVLLSVADRSLLMWEWLVLLRRLGFPLQALLQPLPAFAIIIVQIQQVAVKFEADIGTGRCVFFSGRLVVETTSP